MLGAAGGCGGQVISVCARASCVRVGMMGRAPQPCGRGGVTGVSVIVEVEAFLVYWLPLKFSSRVPGCPCEGFLRRACGKFVNLEAGAEAALSGLLQLGLES